MMFQAILIGFLIALPVGPIGVLCINRSLLGGFIPGLVTGLGAATADAVYGLIAVLGLTAITSFLVTSETYIKLIGGIALCYLAVKILLKKKSNTSVDNSRKSNAISYITTFFLTLTNPATIISFAAVFAALGLGYKFKGIYPSIIMVTGVFIGSLLWWIFLSGGVSLLREKINVKFINYIGLISGSLILIFGLVCIVSAIK